MNLPIKLAERPQRDRRAPDGPSDQAPQPSSQRGPALGMSVREIDSEFANRFRLPDGTQGVIVSRVEPMSPAFDADIERGHVLLEINRRPVRSIDDYRRLTADARAGDILTLYLFKPEVGENGQRALETVRIE
jgi:serine protease Do